MSMTCHMHTKGSSFLSSSSSEPSVLQLIGWLLLAYSPQNQLVAVLLVSGCHGCSCDICTPHRGAGRGGAREGGGGGVQAVASYLPRIPIGLRLCLQRACGALVCLLLQRFIAFKFKGLQLLVIGSFGSEGDWASFARLCLGERREQLRARLLHPRPWDVCGGCPDSSFWKR